jgi:hypothetical protein
MQQGQVPPMIGAAVPPKPTDDPLVSTVPPSNTSRDDRVDVLNNAAKGGNTVIGTLQGNDVYQDDLGEYINTPEGPVYLDGNQLKAVTKAPPSVTPSTTEVMDEISSMNRPSGDVNVTLNQGEYGVNDTIIREDANGNPITYKWDSSKDAYVDNEGLEYNRTVGERVSGLFKSETVKNAEPETGDTQIGTLNGNPVYMGQDGKPYVMEDLEVLGTSAGVQKMNIQPWQTDDIKMLPKENRPVAGPKTPSPKDKDGLVPLPMDTSIPDELSGTPMDSSAGVPKLEEAPPSPTVLPDELQPGQEMDSNKGIALKEVIKKTEGDNTTTGQTGEAATKAGETAPPEQIDEAESFLSGIFGDLFDADELKRMAIMYVGSRIMGGSHNGSMNFAAKQYVNRVDAKAAEKKALAKEERLDKKALAKERRQNVFSLIEKGKKTKDSIAAYEKSGDPRDLVDKPVLTKPPTNTGETKIFYDKGGRGKVTALKMKDDNGNIFYVNSQGKQLNPFAFHEDPSLVPNTKEYIDRELKIGKQMGDALEDLIKRDTLIVDKKEIKPVGFASGSQGIEVARWMNKNKIPVNYMGSILESAYAAAAAEQKTTGNKVTNITSYLDKAFIDRIPGNERGIFTREDGKRVDSGKVINLIGQGVSILRSKPGQESKSDEQLQNDMLAEMRREWFALDDKIRGEYNTKGTNEGETGFMVFMQQQIAEDVKQS